MQHQHLVKSLALGLALLALACAPPAAGRPAVRPDAGGWTELPLTSLQPPCRIWKRWVGSSMLLPWGAWLGCGGRPVLLTHPWNLLGKVDIRTSEQALEYVRFFSSGESYPLFQLEGLIEIRPETSEQDWGQDIVKTLKLGEAFHAPKVREISEDTSCVDEQGREHPCRRKVFYVNRIVLLFDQNVYEIEEEVRQDGFYSVPSKRRLIEDVSRFGILHQGPH
jgi:hypothetical protein